jgi:hypothetical protein
MDPHITYPCPYPPSFLLALRSLGMLPLVPAYVIAIGATLGLYLWATVGRGWFSPLTAAALVAPTTTITAVAGQAGFLCAALLVGGFRLAAGRPIAAGILFGLATYKPQMGILVPVALISARLWRTVAAAGATVVALVVFSGAVLGIDAWQAWLADISRYSRQFAAESSEISHLMPTVSASLTRLGVVPWIATVIQCGAAAIAVWVTWRCFRVGPTALAAAALFVATFLGSPHAFVYDMPMVTTAVVWFIAERHRAGGAFGTGEIVVMIAAMISPITLVSANSRLPFAALSLALLLGIIVLRLRSVEKSVAGA